MTNHSFVLLQNRKRRNLWRNHDSSNCLRSHNVVALYYNGIDLTSTLTGDLPLGPVDFCCQIEIVRSECCWKLWCCWKLATSLASTPRLDFNSPKTFQFYHVQEAYLAITVRGSVGSFAPQLGLASWSERQTLRKFHEIQVRNRCFLHHLQQRRREPQNYITFTWQKCDTLLSVDHNHFGVEIGNVCSMIKAKACDL